MPFCTILIHFIKFLHQIYVGFFMYNKSLLFLSVLFVSVGLQGMNKVDNTTVLQALIKNGKTVPAQRSLDVVESLQRIKKLISDYEEQNPEVFADIQLVDAVNNGDIDNIRAAIKNKADLLIEVGIAPAFFKLYNRLALLQPFLDAGLDINTKNSRFLNVTMFFYTACYVPIHNLRNRQKRRLIDSLRGLQKLGADINAPTCFRKTALMFVAQHKERLFILKALLEMGADIDARDCVGTALKYAVLCKNEEAAKALMEQAEKKKAVEGENQLKCVKNSEQQEEKE